MAAEPDYYGVLGLSRDADPRAIKRAYRTLVRELHPDVPGNAGNAAVAERWKLVREAYEVLSDPARRHTYDRFGRQGISAAGMDWHRWADGNAAPAQDPDEEPELATTAGERVADIFADLFRDESGAAGAGGGGRGGGGAGHGGRSRAESPWTPGAMNRQAEEEIRRERGRAPGGGGGPRVRGVRTSGGDARGDAGTARRFGFDPEQLAEAALMGDLAAADDVGVHEEAEETRRDARGAGRRREPPRPRQGESYRISVQVPFLLAIHGGNYPTQYRIPDAEGRWAMEELELHVPGGLEDGGQIRLPGRGHWGSDGGGRGDLLVDVTVGEHRFFRRDGSDIVVDLPLSPWEAVQGCKLDVPTVYGRATVLVPPGIRSGQRIRIRNLGLLDGGTGRRGNQVLVAQIQTPRDLRPEHVEMLRRIDADLSFDPREGFWIED